jgi:hypothetical protein
MMFPHYIELLRSPNEAAGNAVDSVPFILRATLLETIGRIEAKDGRRALIRIRFYDGNGMRESGAGDVECFAFRWGQSGCAYGLRDDRDQLVGLLGMSGCVGHDSS